MPVLNIDNLRLIIYAPVTDTCPFARKAIQLTRDYNIQTTIKRVTGPGPFPIILWCDRDTQTEKNQEDRVWELVANGAAGLEELIAKYCPKKQFILF